MSPKSSFLSDEAIVKRISQCRHITGALPHPKDLEVVANVRVKKCARRQSPPIFAFNLATRQSPENKTLGPRCILLPWGTRGSVLRQDNLTRDNDPFRQWFGTFFVPRRLLRFGC